MFLSKTKPITINEKHIIEVTINQIPIFKPGDYSSRSQQHFVLQYHVMFANLCGLIFCAVNSH